MKKNDEIILEIEDLSADGAGVGKCDGMAFFVKDALVGDKIKANKAEKNIRIRQADRTAGTVAFSHEAEMSAVPKMRRLSDSGSFL